MAETLRRKGVILCLALLLACLAPWAAEAGTERVRQEFVAGRDIALPVLPGFEEVLGRSAEFDRLMSKFVLPDNRMLAFYISDADMERMAEGSGEGFRRYLIVQTLKQGVFLDGDTRFDAVKASFRDEMAALPAQNLPEVGDVMRDATEYIGSTYKTDMKMEVGESRNQGVFVETKDYIGFLNLSSLAIETAQGKKSYPAAVAMMAVNVRGRLILVYSYYSNYELLSDVDFVKDTAKMYADMLLHANVDNVGGNVIRNIILICLFVSAAMIAGMLVFNRLQSGKWDKAV
ncbi:MAG: hypothetical protein Q8K65_07360 [Alphaproteobacteria bacterium]|nr:hypothetical protein [Alphaproteobacteria bacterium]